MIPGGRYSIDFAVALEIDKRLNQAVKLTEMMSAGLKRAETFRADAAKAARGDAA